MLNIKSTINFSLRSDLFIDELENKCTEIRKPRDSNLPRRKKREVVQVLVILVL